MQYFQKKKFCCRLLSKWKRPAWRRGCEANR
jgi:hypothetical protein